MKNWMKIFCLILAAMMLAGVIASCSDDGDESLLSVDKSTTATQDQPSGDQPSGEPTDPSAATQGSTTPAGTIDTPTVTPSNTPFGSQTAPTETPTETPTVTPTVPSGPEISSLKLSKSGVSLRVGDSETLTYYVTPENADVSGLVWSVQDSEVATVVNGKITAVGVGSTTVFLKSSDGVISVNARVEVVEGEVKVIPVESLVLSKTLIIMKKGEQKTLAATVGPENATDKTVNYVSASAAIATVDQMGVIKAVGAGLTTIKATCGKISKECMLIVQNEDGTLPSSLTTEKTVQIGKTVELTTDKYDALTGLTLVSADETKLTVSGTTATGVAAGSVEVALKDAEGNTLYIFKVNVSEQPTNLPITGIKIDKGEKVTVEVGKTVKLTATLLPEGAVEARIEWINECETQSGKPKYEGIYSLNQSGEVTGLKVGTAPVTAYTKDPTTGKEFTRVCWVQVVEAGTQPEDDYVKLVGISVVKDDFKMKVGESVTIEYTLIPANATDNRVDYVIEPADDGTRDYVKIDRQTGVVTALRAVTGGKITVCTTDDNINKSVHFTITD